jgi:hypothetical protein
MTAACRDECKRISAKGETSLPGEPSPAKTVGEEFMSRY